MKLYRLTTIILSLMQINKSSSLCGQLQPTLVPSLTRAFRTHRWPWHAAIYHHVNETSSIYQCGGTLISSSSILTAAHCVELEARLLSVSLGRLNLDASEGISLFIKVAKVIRHPKFVSENLENDIAIITLTRNVRFNNFVQPICLWDVDKTDISEVIGKSGTVVGWGVTETREISNELREASLPVVSLVTCLRSNRDLYGRYLSDTNYCAGARDGTSVCTGDSGGSMVFKENGTYHIRGIVSVSATEVIRETSEYVCDSKQYAVFTDVAQFLPWIKENVAFECDAGFQCSTNKEALSCGQLSTTRTHNWPWHAAITISIKNNNSNSTLRCGGTLISASSVLVAAHCVSMAEGEHVSVSLGKLNVDDATESSSQFMNVAEIIRYSDFTLKDLQNNIAILTLATKATFNNYVQPICLWNASRTDLSELIGKSGTVIGWETETRELSNKFRVVSARTCLRSNRSFYGYYLSDKVYCAGSLNDTTVCASSTGSMVFEENGIYYIRGIVSVIATMVNRETQELECDPSQYTIFTDVAQFLPWIEQNVVF